MGIHIVPLTFGLDSVKYWWLVCMEDPNMKMRQELAKRMLSVSFCLGFDPTPKIAVVTLIDLRGPTIS